MEYKSPNRIVNSVLRLIGEETMSNVEIFINEAMSRSYQSFSSEEEITTFFDSTLAKIYSKGTPEDIENIRYYTGPAFKDINAVLRNNWNYEVNGLLTEQRQKELIDTSKNINASIEKTSCELPSDIRVYRGVTIDSFKEYGINSIDDLKNMIGQYFYERGFTSTSLIKDKSSFNSDLDHWKDYNIEIEYLVPQEFSEGVPLITENLSYSGIKQEYLINTGCLSKIVDVSINDDKTVHLKSILIPKKIWDLNYKNSKNMEDTI